TPAGAHCTGRKAFHTGRMQYTLTVWRMFRIPVILMLTEHYCFVKVKLTAYVTPAGAHCTGRKAFHTGRMQYALAVWRMFRIPVILMLTEHYSFVMRVIQ
ncbi:MAG: hypothetical protein V2I97_00365, partial [Desulfococcaceae bacterium]|nr:hypothetical protein [Desulfococcaceae bacterium]